MDASNVVVCDVTFVIVLLDTLAPSPYPTIYVIVNVVFCGDCPYVSVYKKLAGSNDLSKLVLLPGIGEPIFVGVGIISSSGLVEVPEHSEHAEYKHYMFIKPQLLGEGWSRDRIVNEIVAQGVPCFHGSCSEVYLEKAFDNTSFRPEKRLPNAVELGQTSLMLLVHPTLTQSEIDKTIMVIKQVITLAEIPLESNTK